MALPYKPHTATVAAIAAGTTGRQVTSHSRSGSTSVRGMLEEINPEVAVRDFGLAVDFPGIWLCDLTDAVSIKVGDKITVNARDYYVKAGPQKMDAVALTAHARYLVGRFA